MRVGSHRIDRLEGLDRNFNEDDCEMDRYVNRGTLFSN